jgi:hypothetical protein
MRSETQPEPVDILDILLSAPDPAEEAGQTALDRLIRRAAGRGQSARETPSPDTPAAAPAPAAPTRRPARATTARKKEKIKTTQYLGSETHDRLARVRDVLAAGAHSRRSKIHGRVSKSRIVETALRQALDEFETKGRDSRLARALETVTDEA